MLTKTGILVESMFAFRLVYLISRVTHVFVLKSVAIFEMERMRIPVEHILRISYDVKTPRNPLKADGGQPAVDPIVHTLNL